MIGYSCIGIGGKFIKIGQIHGSVQAPVLLALSQLFSKHTTVGLQCKWFHKFSKSANDYISSYPNR